MEDRKLVGVLSDRDVNLLLSTRPGLSVEYAMTPKPYVVPSEMPLNRVAREMAERKRGSAVVMDHHGEVAGVFTTTDALAALADALENRHVRPVYESVTLRPSRRRTRPVAREAG